MLRDVQNQYGSNLPTPFFLDFEKPHGFLAYALLKTHTKNYDTISKCDSWAHVVMQKAHVLAYL